MCILPSDLCDVVVLYMVLHGMYMFGMYICLIVLHARMYTCDIGSFVFFCYHNHTNSIPCGCM